MPYNKKYKIIFFGTHDFAVQILKKLLETPFLSVEKVITQPDKPSGRGQKLTPPPVKLYAIENGLEVLQPQNLKDVNLENFQADLGIVTQYGLIIPNKILDTLRPINIHPSLLPKYRGASPIQSALINGDKQTGVTIMKLDSGLDTGPIISQKELNILPDETYLELEARLAELSNELLSQTIPDYLDNKLIPKPQDDSLATYCGQFNKKSGKIDWDKPALEIYNLYRGLTPWPGIWTMWNDKRLKLNKIKSNSEQIPQGQIQWKDNQLLVGASVGSIQILELQLEGKKAMTTKDFLNGFPKIIGEILH